MNFGKLRNLGLGVLALAIAACGTENAGQDNQTTSGESTAHVAVSQPEGQEVPSSVTVGELKKVIDAQEEGVVILDVRTPGEVANGMIANAEVIDYQSADFEAQIKNLDPTKHYYVYCATGGRSGRTVSLMENLGFAKTTNVEGGITAWKAAGYAVEK